MMGEPKQNLRSKIVGYEPVEGSHISKKDAVLYGAELTRLAEAGLGKPEDWPVAARSADSPLHRYFTWDNEVAGDKWRVQEARQLKSSIILLTQKPNGGEITRGPILFSIQSRSSEDGPERSYQTYRMVAQDEDKVRQVIQEARKSLDSWAARYESYRKLFPEFGQKYVPVFDAIEQIQHSDELAAVA